MDDEAFRNEFQRGCDLWHDSQADAAVNTFSDLVVSCPDDWRARLMLGAYLWMSGRSAESESHLRQVTELRPTLERASMLLFHVLWELGREDEAFAEMDRFLAVGDPNEYRQLIADWHPELREKSEIA